MQRRFTVRVLMPKSDVYVTLSGMAQFSSYCDDYDIVTLDTIARKGRTRDVSPKYFQAFMRLIDDYRHVIFED